MYNVEFIVKQVNATMRMEDMILKEEDKNRIRMCIADDSKFNNELKNLIQKHSVKSEL